MNYLICSSDFGMIYINNLGAMLLIYKNEKKTTIKIIHKLYKDLSNC